MIKTEKRYCHRLSFRKLLINYCNMQKGISLIYILIGLAIIGIVGSGAYFLGKNSSKSEVVNPPTQKACTEEGKQCPDGSYVSRSGPNCEFAGCPNSLPSPIDETANWKTYTNIEYGFSFKYPKEWSYTAIFFDGGGTGVGFYSDETKKEKQLTVNILGNENFDILARRIDLTSPETVIDGYRTLKYETGVYIRLNSSEILSIYRSQYPDTNSYLKGILSTFKFTK